MKFLLFLLLAFPLTLLGQSNPGYSNIKGSNNIAVTVTGSGATKALWINDHILFTPPATNAPAGQLLAIDGAGHAYWSMGVTVFVTNNFLTVTNFTVISNLFANFTYITNLFVNNEYVSNSFITNLTVNNEFVTNLTVNNEFVTNLTVQTEIVTNITVINNTVLSNLFLTNGTIYATNTTVFINGVSNLSNINPTDGRIPVRANATTFTNSPFVVVDANRVSIGALTLNGLGNSLISSGQINLQSAQNSSLNLAEGTNVLSFVSQFFYPALSNKYVLGTQTQPFQNIFLVTNTLNGSNGSTNYYSDNGTNLLRNGIPIGGSITFGTNNLNPTIGFLPYKQSGTNFGDSPLVRLDSRSVGVGSLTNVLSSTGTDLLYTNDTTAGVGAFLRVIGGDSPASAAKFGAHGGDAHIQAATAHTVWLQPNNGGSAIVIFPSQVLPSASNTFDIGSATLPFVSLYLQTNTLFLGTNRYSDNGSALIRNGVPIGGTNITGQPPSTTLTNLSQASSTNWLLFSQAVKNQTNVPPTDFQKVIASTATNCQTILYLTNTIFAGTVGGGQAKLFKFNASDLSSFTSTNFPNDGFHGLIQDMLWSTSKQRIYIMFYDSSELTVSEVNPDTLAITDVILDDFDVNDEWSMTCDETYLYIAGFDTPTIRGNAISQFKMSDWTLNKTIIITNTATQNPAMRYDPITQLVYGYCGTNYGGGVFGSMGFSFAPDDMDNYVLKLSPATPWIQLEPAISFIGDFAYSCEYGANATLGTRVYRMNKSTLDIDAIYTGLTNDTIGAYAQAGFLWLSSRSNGVSVARISRLNPATMQIDHAEFPPTNNICVLTGDGTNRLFAVSRHNQSEVYRFSAPIVNSSLPFQWNISGSVIYPGSLLSSNTIGYAFALGSYMEAYGGNTSDLFLSGSSNANWVNIIATDADRTTGDGSRIIISDEVGALMTLTPYAPPIDDRAYQFNTYNGITNAHTRWAVQGTNIMSLWANGSISTVAPPGSSSPGWKLGGNTNNVSVIARATNTLVISVGGTNLYIPYSLTP